MRLERTVKDKSYRRHWLGEQVGSFLRYKRVREECSQHTLDSYETTLVRLVLDHPDAETLELFSGAEGADLIDAFIDFHWGEASPATRDNRIACLNSFFVWAEDTERISRAPRIKRKRRDRGQSPRRPHELAEIHYIARGQEAIEDEIALLLMGRLGFRKMDVGNFRARDVDLAHDLVYIESGKGGVRAELPIAFEDLRQALSLWLTTVGNEGQYLWHPRGNPRRKPNQSTVHRRFKRCLERAGVEDFQMHELRHSAGDRLWRTTGELFAASQLLRHKSLEHTRRYLHPTQDDLRARLALSDQNPQRGRLAAVRSTPAGRPRNGGGRPEAAANAGVCERSVTADLAVVRAKE